MENDGVNQGLNERLSIYIISDSLGDTATSLVTAAMSQFRGTQSKIERLTKISSIDDVKEFMTPRIKEMNHKVAFYTIADLGLKEQVVQYVKSLGIVEVDLLGPAVDAISKATGSHPNRKAGINRELDAAYFKRIEAMDYAVDHDDGRLPEEYKDADIVLMGVSRTSKTPLSMYLASYGYKVANLPLALGITPPKQIFSVPNWRIFGLMSSPDVLSDIRSRRLGEVPPEIAKNYADVEYIVKDLAEARALMRKLGCIVIHTEKRAIEETAQEILRYYNMALESHRE